MKKIYFLLVLLLLFSNNAFSHESRPLYLKITETEQELVFELNLPNTVNDKNLPTIYVNDTAINKVTNWVLHTAGYRQKWQLNKPSFVLKGATLKIDYPIFNPVLSTIIAIKYLAEEEQILVIPPNKNKMVIPKAVNAKEVQIQYSILGMEHIWAGIDHLLFLVCLLIITGFSRKLFITITGFTLAHSITLVLSALKIIQLPIPPIEATIALSIVFLCYEIIHHHKDKASLTYRHPILVASSFGLLHGLGFAAVLGEIGLPKKHSIEALLFFNVGVEIGQLIFMMGLLIITFVIGKIGVRFIPEKLLKQVVSIGLKVAIYFVGILAAYWMFERII